MKSDGSGDNSAPGGGVRSLDILSGTARRERAGRRHSVLPSNVMQAVIGVKFIADHMKQQDEEIIVRLSLALTSSLSLDNFLIVVQVIIMLLIPRRQLSRCCH